MGLRERYNQICSDFLFEKIADKYDIFILIRMHIDVPFFGVKNDALRVLRETL